MVKTGVGTISGLSFENNLDCMPVSYELANSGQTQSGCYMQTAFGGLDVENGLSSFPGTNGKAIPIIPYVAHEVLLGWPGTVDVLALDNTPTDGAYVSIYRDIIGVLKDERGLDGQLQDKRVTAPPSGSLYDGNGQRIVVNPNTVSYSAGGSWLAVETMTGAFVRINLATLDVTPFAPSVTKVGSQPGLSESQLAISEDGHYAAIANAAAGFFKVYDLTDCAAGATGQPYLQCSVHDYWPFAASQVSGLQSIRHIRFVSDGLISFVAVTDSGTYGYEMAPSGSIGALSNYLALGDSYTSGEGAYDYVPGTDTATDHCHLSTNSYPLLLVNDLPGLREGHSMACSGATSADILPSSPTNYRGQVEDGIPEKQRSDDQISTITQEFTPGYLDQSTFVSQYQPRIMTVSIGGNDVGFGDILEQCVEPHLSQHITGQNTCYGTYEQRLEEANTIDREVGKLTTLLKRLQAKSPNTTIYVVGYPQIAVDDGSCALNVQLNTSELEFSEEVVKNLDAAIGKAAKDSGTNYVDISQALAGHRLCESSQVAVNGLVAGTAGGINTTVAGVKVKVDFLGKESYHPNALGQHLIEAAIRKQTNNFTTGSAPTDEAYKSAGSDTSGLLNAPASGAAIATVIPDDGIADSGVVPGSSLAINVNGLADGLEPGSSYSVKIGGANGPTVGTIISDQNGNLSGSVAIPPNGPVGAQTIDVTGQNQAGDPVDVTTVIYIIVSSNDYDGDGISNSTDSCPTIPNSGIDSDQDGIDDICDPVISSSGTTGSGPGDSSGTVTTTDGSDNSSNTASGSTGPDSSSDSDNQTGDDTATSNDPNNMQLTVASRESGPLVTATASRDSDDNGTLLQGNIEGAFTVAATSESTALLGAKTANPASLSHAQMESSMVPRASHKQSGSVTLGVIHWIPWAGGLLVLWLLVLLSGFLVRLTRPQYA